MLADSKVVAQIPVHDPKRARKFYTDVLGLKPGMEAEEGMFMDAGDGTALMLYRTPSAGQAQHTLASWKVDNLESEMAELRGRGVQFEEYDMPEVGLKTEDGVARSDLGGAAWFKDSEGNILCIAEMS